MPWEYRRRRWYHSPPPLGAPEKILLGLAVAALLLDLVLRLVRRGGP